MQERHVIRLQPQAIGTVAGLAVVDPGRKVAAGAADTSVLKGGHRVQRNLHEAGRIAEMGDNVGAEKSASDSGDTRPIDPAIRSSRVSSTESWMRGVGSLSSQSPATR